MSSRLAHLAALNGIDLEYHDIWGRSHRAPEASLIAVLEAMGVTADSADAVEASIAAHEATRWRTVMDPAIVVSADASEHSVRLRLPAVLDDVTLRWILHEEHGARHTGALVPSQLAVAEQASIVGTRYSARVMPLRLQLPPGYHRLEGLYGLARAGSCGNSAWSGFTLTNPPPSAPHCATIVRRSE